jgi:hypothetical protein
MKLACIALLTFDLETANFMANNPQTPNDVLLVLKKHVNTLSYEHTSLRNAMICDYLSFKNDLMKIADHVGPTRSVYLKMNSSLRVLRNFYDPYIALEEGNIRKEKFRIWPTVYPNLPVSLVPGRKLPIYFRVYNPVGAAIFETINSVPEDVVINRTKLEVHSDLLQIVLDKRLKRKVSLKARAFGDEYIVDIENKKIFSPGPDGEAGTKDDIKLWINPDLLVWDN